MKAIGTPKRLLGRPLWPILILFLCLVVSGFTSLWYQRQIVRLGRCCQALEAEELALSRQLAMAQARMAKLQTSTLARHCGETDLVLPSADRLVHVSRREVHRPRRTLSAMEMPTAVQGRRN